jgi:peptide/nickel transport system substrate-binding protein
MTRIPIPTRRVRGRPAALAALALAVLAGGFATRSAVGILRAEGGPAAHDARETPPEPAYGGRVTLHIESMPPGLNLALDTSNVGLRIAHVLHESLMRVDWGTLAWTENLCRERVVEDSLFLLDGTRLYGAVEQTELGFAVAPRSRGNPLAEPVVVAAREVARLERDTVYTYALRDDVLWHPAELADGRVVDDQRLDARDLLFSLSIYANPLVRCDAVRPSFEGVEGQAVDERTVRFLFPRQYFRGDLAVGVMTILPSHLFDLADPDHARHAPDASEAERAREINDSPYNLRWVGLGAYRVVEFGPQLVEARRFERYFDPERAGWLDVVRWRHVPDAALMQALYEGEIDFTGRLTSEDFFGRATEREEFTSRYDEGWFYGSTYGAVVWNVARPELADVAVRRALARAFDFERYLADVYRGQARQVTGSMPYFSDAYDRALAPYAYDPPLAEAELDAAGWYDRDGDGVRDKDGVALSIEYLMPAGSASANTIGLELQQAFAKVGVRLDLGELEWAAFRERQERRDFEALPVGWYPPLEPDPWNLWHSSNVEQGANYAGLVDEEVDRLIELGRRETDHAARMQVWHALQRRVYELQPYLFLFNVPVRYALRKDLCGFQAVGTDPYYVVRRWYHAAGTPGTRATRREGR